MPGHELAWRAQTASRILADGAYRFDAPGKTAKKERGARKITLLVGDKVSDELKKAVQQGRAVAEGIALAKDLGNLPGQRLQSSVSRGDSPRARKGIQSRRSGA